MSMYHLDGLVAIVTGAGRERGIGRATARRLAREGALVVLSDVGHPPKAWPEYKVGLTDDLQRAVDEIVEEGGSAIGVLADVTDAESVQHLVEETVSTFGKVDILVNVAGVGMGAPTLEMEPSVWNYIFAVNTAGVFLCSAVVGRQMVKQGQGGSIVSVASMAAKIGGSNRPRPVDAPWPPLPPQRPGGGAAYAASKAAVVTFTRAFAMEMAPYGVTVNAVCPGFIDTQLLMPGMERRAQERGQSINEFLDEFVKHTIPLGRMGTGDDVANVIAFLCSQEARYITGEAINVTGGCEMH